MSSGRLALMIDLDRCTGCKSCEAACKQEHGLGPGEYRNKVLWLETPGAAKVDLLAVTCQHCDRPACLRACPVNPKAIVKDAITGVVAVDEQRCTGCGECVVACPYGAMGFDPIDNHAVKCDLCADRRARGERPACASVCPGHAIRFGARDALIDEADRDGRARLDNDPFLMGPATIYLRAGTREGADVDAGGTSRAPHPVAVLADPLSREPLAQLRPDPPYRVPRAERTPDRVVPGACNICFNGCPVKYHLKDGRVVAITGNDEDPVFRGRVCPKSQMLLQLYNHRGRITRALRRVGPRGAGHFEPVTWDEALDEIAARLVRMRERHGPESLAVFSGTRSGFVTNNGYLRLFAQLWGTPNTESTEPLCSSGKNVAYTLVQGGRALANSYTPGDIGSASLFLYVGDNQAETRPVYFGMINDWRKRSGARLVVVDPRLSGTAAKADLWLPIRSGTDMALGLAMIHHIFARGLHDAAFCAHWVEGWERWRDFVHERGYSPAWAAGVTDIARERIEALAEEVAAADGCMIYASRGVNQHSNATQTNRVFMFLAAITGNWGRRGGGYFNISTTQYVRAEAPAARRARITRPAVARTPVAWLEAMARGTPYPVTALICANNPFSNWPSQKALRAAARELDLLVHLAIFPNETSDFADFVLPLASGIEKGGLSRAAEERRLVWNDR
ncbi:MAG: molybdopterin-dependent oxidoreductase, partial [Gammaproteobacteria bacterium]|nr:molybdopterin-dependent oxidoreductase [Gammaproteobacteria bacterium]